MINHKVFFWIGLVILALNVFAFYLDPSRWYNAFVSGALLITVIDAFIKSYSGWPK